jgi:hypothetical protein
MSQETSPSVARRASIINEISKATLVDRCKTHGDAEDNFNDIATFWNVQLKGKLKAPLTALDVATMMVAMKLCRAACNPDHIDHYVDAGGYAVCAGGILASMQAKGTASSAPPAS